MERFRELIAGLGVAVPWVNCPKPESRSSPKEKSHEPKLTFGGPLAINRAGTVAVVGRPYSHHNGKHAGEAYVLTFNGKTWKKTATLGPGESGDHFGAAVAINRAGDELLIGAPLATSMHYHHAGKTYLFRYDGFFWVMSEVFSGSWNRYEMGTSVAIDKDQIAIGAPGYFPSYPWEPTGAVHLFERVPNSEKWLPTTTLIPDKACHIGSRFGQSVAVQDRNILVGAPTTGISNHGSALYYTFDYDRDDFFRRNLTLEEGIQPGSRFGTAVALGEPSWDGIRRLVVTAPGHGASTHAKSGMAIVFEAGNDPESMREPARLTIEPPVENQRLGTTVCLATNHRDEPVIALGACHTQGEGYLFSPGPEATWRRQKVTLISSSIAPSEPRPAEPCLHIQPGNHGNEEHEDSSSN